MPICYFINSLRIITFLTLIILSMSIQQSYAATIAIMGDDYIGKFGHFDEEDTFASQIAKDGKKIESIDFTRDGETSTTIIDQIPSVIASNPDVVIVAVGMNDAINKVEPDIIYNSLDTLIRELQRNQMYVLLLGYHAPSTLSHNYILRFNQIYNEVTKRHKVTFVGNIMDKIENNESFLQSDNMHPNKWGVEKMVAKALPTVHDMMRKREQEEYRRAIQKKLNSR